MLSVSVDKRKKPASSDGMKYGGKTEKPFRVSKCEVSKHQKVLSRRVLNARHVCYNFLPKLKCAAALLLYSLALRSWSLQFTLIPSV